METLVECYASARYPERPRAFIWKRERLEVAEIERRWRTPVGLAFRVRVVNGRTFTLTYDETADAWDIQPA
jgi:hypothetical protein